MTDLSHSTPDAKDGAPPLARRLRALGFIVDDVCLQPKPELLGHLHLHRSDSCSQDYCDPCAKPLYILVEVVPHEPDFEGESEVDSNDLCYVCAHCGVIYDCNEMKDDAGVLCHLVAENMNLIEALSVFEGVPAEGRIYASLMAALDAEKAALERGLAANAARRDKLVRGEEKPKAPKSKSKSRGGLSLVVTPSDGDDSKPPAT